MINLGHANHPAVLSCFDQLVELIHSRNLTPVTTYPAPSPPPEATFAVAVARHAF